MEVSIAPYGETKDRETKVKFIPDDLFSLNITLAKVIAPALREFSDYTSNYPSTMETSTEWIECLDKMTKAFDLLSDEEQAWDRADDAVIQEGLQLFAKWYNHLWD